MISSLICPSCQEKRKHKISTKKDLRSCCGEWGSQAVVDGEWGRLRFADTLVFLPLDSAWVRDLAENRWPLLKQLGTASLMKALFTKVWKELRELAKKWQSILGLETLELETENSWGFGKETQSYANHCQQTESLGVSSQLSSLALNSFHCLQDPGINQKSEGKGTGQSIKGQHEKGRTLHLEGKEKIFRIDFHFSLQLEAK